MITAAVVTVCSSYDKHVTTATVTTCCLVNLVNANNFSADSETICGYSCSCLQRKARSDAVATEGGSSLELYTRSPLEDSRLFGPGPWKVLATTYEQMGS